tara:strand:- start:24 stop:338 length:315 start_codon:yes stop_codon:yes gene_type:complete
MSKSYGIEHGLYLLGTFKPSRFEAHLITGQHTLLDTVCNLAFRSKGVIDLYYVPEFRNLTANILRVAVLSHASNMAASGAFNSDEVKGDANETEFSDLFKSLAL